MVVNGIWFGVMTPVKNTVSGVFVNVLMFEVPQTRVDLSVISYVWMATDSGMYVPLK